MRFFVNTMGEKYHHHQREKITIIPTHNTTTTTTTIKTTTTTKVGQLFNENEHQHPTTPIPLNQNWNTINVRRGYVWDILHMVGVHVCVRNPVIFNTQHPYPHTNTGYHILKEG